MFLSDVSKLSRGSHAKVSIECSLKNNDKCRGIVTSEYRDIMNTIERNHGSYICLYCSRRSKNNGENNPNFKYSYDRNMFNEIDTVEKAYFLGWVASDGSICKHNWTVSISILSKDLKCLERLRDIICEELPITYKKNIINSIEQEFVCLQIHSQQICEDICKCLSINRGKKSDCVNFPKLNSEELTWAFIRGYFEGDGTIRDIKLNHGLDCSITSDSINMLKDISEFSKIPNTISNTHLIYSGTNCLDFMGKVYENKGDLFLERKFEKYCEWLIWKPSIIGKGCKVKLPCCYVNKTDKDAVLPSKTNYSDAGFDLTIIKEHKKLTQNTILYDTGIKIKVNQGLYAEIVPRSSLSKSGYMLANSIGIIDCSYKGNLYIALTKIDNTMPDLTLPFRCCQLIFREQIHVDLEEVTSFEEQTSRGSGGFGSTGN